MKKYFFSFISVFLVILFAMLSVTFSVSAASDFTVQDGVLIKYNGNSKNVSIPADVYYIADGAFKNNTVIESVDFNNVTMIGNDAFRGCTALKKITEYDSITYCGAYAFYGTLLQSSYTGTELVIGSVLVASNAEGSYIIPSSVNSVAPYAFSQNEDITSVTIGQNVVSIGEGAFYKCKNLKSVSVSSSVNYIGAFAFEGTSYLSSATNEFLVLGNGILVKSNSTKSEITIPSDIKQIGEGAFYNNKKITKVTFSSTVTGIGMRAFANCTALTSVQLPENLLMLGQEAFSGCTSVNDVTIPASVKEFGESAFLGCTKLKTVSYFSDADICRGLFAGCTALEAVRVSSDVSKVSSLAFYNCTSLRTLSLPTTVTSVSDDSFKNCSKLSVYTDSKSETNRILKSKGIKTYEIGDSNGDGVINVRDATHIQKAVAGMVTLDFTSTLKADADFSGVINIRDATWVQKRVAGVV